ncbi:MAG TPA: hypothetical protein VHS26_01535, partial [Solirubrobacteraceae bacterium]|nr:hypothetical protein [Solirubrobacteraceae bacterium]
SSQNSIYLVAGVTALVGGAAVLAFVRSSARPELRVQPRGADAEMPDATQMELEPLHAGGVARA